MNDWGAEDSISTAEPQGAKLKKIGVVILLLKLVGVLGAPVYANSGYGIDSGDRSSGAASFRLVSALGPRHLDVDQIEGSMGMEQSERSKSPNRAFLSSLIIPGSGQLYLGAKRGYFYIAAEVGMLAVYFVTRRDAENTREQYREHVRNHVAFDGPGGFDSWDPVEDYEHATLFDNWHNVYTERNGEPLDRVGAWYWRDRQAFKDEDREGQHDSPARLMARQWRDEANDKFERARTFLGIAILNHVISAVEARIYAKRSNRHYVPQARAPRSFGLDVQTTISPDAAETQLVLRKLF